MSRVRRNSLLAAAALALLAVLGIAGPAMANSANTSGSQADANTVSYWETARTDTHDANADSFDLKTISDLAGGTFTVAMRKASGATYARVTFSSLNSYHTIKNDNGNSYNPPGTFYLNTEVTGYCGEDGCGTITWTAAVQWNIQVA